MTRVMGILNTTPDSFSDGGLWTEPGRAVKRALEMVAQGADIIDVGGESTRPGARSVETQQELDRVLPVVEALVAESAVTVSVDTSKPDVMTAAVAAGAGLINDVFALRQAGALEAAAGLGVPVCLMHMQGKPRDMQTDPSYADVVGEVEEFLLQRARSCEAAGISRDRIWIDPGFGFGKKTPECRLAEARRHLARGRRRPVRARCYLEAYLVHWPWVSPCNEYVVVCHQGCEYANEPGVIQPAAR